MSARAPGQLDTGISSCRESYGRVGPYDLVGKLKLGWKRGQVRITASGLVFESGNTNEVPEMEP